MNGANGDRGDEQGESNTRWATLEDPVYLSDEDTVVRNHEREVDEDTLDDLRKRHEQIDGVVQVGVLNSSGELLLVGPDEWAPPGGPVEPGEDWVVAARRNLLGLTDARIRRVSPVMVEHTHYYREGETEREHIFTVVHFVARLADSPRQFETDPTVAEELDHPVYRDGSEVELAWFGDVPEDAHPNHENEIRLFLNQNVP